MGFPINPRPMNPMVSGMDGSIVTPRSDVRTLHGTGPPGAVLCPVRSLATRGTVHRVRAPAARPPARGRRRGPPILADAQLRHDDAPRDRRRQPGLGAQDRDVGGNAARRPMQAGAPEGAPRSRPSRSTRTSGRSTCSSACFTRPAASVAAHLTGAGVSAGRCAGLDCRRRCGRSQRARVSRRAGAGHHSPRNAGRLPAGAAAQRARVGAARPGLSPIRRVPGQGRLRPAGSCTRSTTARRPTPPTGSRRTSSPTTPWPREPWSKRPSRSARAGTSTLAGRPPGGASTET